MQIRPSALAHILLIAVVFVWGTTFVLVKDALSDVSPLLFNLLRMAIGFTALAIVNRRHLRHVTRRTLLPGALVGLFLAGGYQFQTAGLARTTPAKSAFITGLVVVLVPLLAAIPALRSPEISAPRFPAAIGALLAFLGLILLTTPSRTPWRSTFASIGLGDLLTLVCALAFAGHLLTLAHVSRKIPSGLLATLQVGAATVFMALTLPLESLTGGSRFNPTPRLFVALAITGLLATAAAFTIQSWAQQHLSPTHTALIITLEPVFAWLTSLLFFHERLSPRSFSGAGLILAGIACIELLPVRGSPAALPASN